MPRLLAATLLALLASASAVLAQGNPTTLPTNALDGLNRAAGINGGPYRPVSTPGGVLVQLASLIGLLVNALLTFLGVIFMLLIISAGFRWMLARGNESAVEEAKHTITSASIGLVIIIGAYALVQFIEYFITQSGVFK